MDSAATGLETHTHGLAVDRSGQVQQHGLGASSGVGHAVNVDTGDGSYVDGKVGLVDARLVDTGEALGDIDGNGGVVNPLSRIKRGRGGVDEERLAATVTPVTSPAARARPA